MGLILIVATVCAVWASGMSDASEIDRDMVPQPYDIEDLVAPVGIDEAVTKENFDKIKNGMSREAVESLFQKPSAIVLINPPKDKSIETYNWDSDDLTKYIEVTFKKNKVVAKNQKGLD